MLGHCMPHANLAGRGQRHQLVADKEQILDANVQIEDAHVGFAAVVRDAPQPNLAAVRDGHHFAVRFLVGIGEVHFDGQPLDGRLDVGRREHQLPAGRVLQAIAGDKVRIRGRYPIVVGFDDLHAQRVTEAGLLVRIEHQADVVADDFVEISGRIARVP